MTSPKMCPSSRYKTAVLGWCHFPTLSTSCLHRFILYCRGNCVYYFSAQLDFGCLLYTLTLTSKVAKLASTGSWCSDVKQSGAFKVNKRGRSIIVQHLAFTCSFFWTATALCLSPLHTGILLNKWCPNIHSEYGLLHWDYNAFIKYTILPH